jgi:hypothetical protein
MRLDDVLIRIRDTRIYVDFGRGKIIRDYTEREDGFDKVKKVQLRPNFIFFNIIRTASELLSVNLAYRCYFSCNNRPSKSVHLRLRRNSTHDCSVQTGDSSPASQ